MSPGRCNDPCTSCLRGDDWTGHSVQDDRGHKGEAVRDFDAEAAQFLHRAHAVHAGAVVGPIEVVEGLPPEGEVKVAGQGVQFKQGGDVKLFVVGAVQALDAAVVAFSHPGVAAERGPEGAEDIWR